MNQEVAVSCAWIRVLTASASFNGMLQATAKNKQKMTETQAENGAVCEAITVHNFSERILEQTVHFHVMKHSGGFFLWVGSGSAPELSNLAVSMSSKYDSMPLSTLLLGDPSNTAPNSLAQRLAKKTKKQVFVSYSVPMTDSKLSLLVENRIKNELEIHPEHF